MLHTMLDPWTSFVRSPWSKHIFRSCTRKAPHEAGDFVADRFDSDAGSLRYKLFIPSTYVGAPIPLIVMLHGGGQDASDFALGTGMNALGEQYGCLIAYPEQSSAANWSMCWNWFDEAHHHRDRGEPALIAGLTKQIQSSYAVDRTRVYIAGLSAGGAMAVILARSYPDLFAAVGSHSGLPHGSATGRFGAMRAMWEGAARDTLVHAGPAASVPVIAFHGDQDATVHPNNSIDIVEQCIGDYTAATQHTHAKVSLSKETGTRGGRGFSKHVHRGKTGRVLAEHWTIHGTGHAWSGGNTRGSYTDANGPNASREMLRFFLRCRRKDGYSPHGSGVNY